MLKSIKTIFKLFLIVIFLITHMLSGTISELKGKNIFFIDDTSLSLIKKVEKAEKKFDKNFKGNYFLTGYHVNITESNNFTGTCITSSEKRISRIFHDGDNLSIYHHLNNNQDMKSSYKRRIVLFLHKKENKDSKIVNAAMLNGGIRYRIEKLPLFMLSDPKMDESFIYIENLFNSSSDNELKKRLLGIIGAHDYEKVSPFLYKTADRNSDSKLRRIAVFWLGSAGVKNSFHYLKKLSDKAVEKKIIKSLIFAFYNLNSKEGIRELIRIAKGANSFSVKKDAIFWLGQRASKEGIKALKDVIINDKNTNVKNSAVFAISQLENDKSIPILIDIAKNNKNPRIKKKAIFWLGQKDDKRVINFFENILLK